MNALNVDKIRATDIDLKLLFENFNIENFDNVDLGYLLEASPYRSDLLKSIDDDFAALKKERTNKNIKSLMNHVKQFTGIDHVPVSIKPDFDNAFVMCDYTRQLSIDVLNILKNYKFDEKTDLNIRTIQEPVKYIEKLYVVYGDRFLSNLSPRQLTAVLLHELGHCFNYTSNLPGYIISILRKVFTLVGAFPKIIILPLIGIGLTYATLITAVCFAIGRSLTFLEHRGEYKADQFAVKYGYGDELVQVFYKFYQEEQEVKKHYSFLKKLAIFLFHVFFPQSHPELKNRIEKLTDKILNEYIAMYPEARKELIVILSNLKKRG